jgi:hypothetical protein
LLPPLNSNVTPPLPNPVGFFQTTLNPMVEFSSFAAQAAIENHEFIVRGRFTLGTMSNGINPVSEAVTLNVNGYIVTVTPGSFRLGSDGSWKFRGIVNGNPLQMQISPLGNSLYSVSAQGGGSNLAGSPISITLTIGDDSGTATAEALGE